MRLTRIAFSTSLVLLLCATLHAAPLHVWQKQEIVLKSRRAFANPYTDATVWVDLSGPKFHKRVYGFWDGRDMLGFALPQNKNARAPLRSPR